MTTRELTLGAEKFKDIWPYSWEQKAKIATNFLNNFIENFTEEAIAFGEKKHLNKVRFTNQIVTTSWAKNLAEVYKQQITVPEDFWSQIGYCIPCERNLLDKVIDKTVPFMLGDETNFTYVDRLASALMAAESDKEFLEALDTMLWLPTSGPMAPPSYIYMQSVSYRLAGIVFLSFCKSQSFGMMGYAIGSEKFVEKWNQTTKEIVDNLPKLG